MEYVAIYRSGNRQIPSNQEAESHVVSFTLGAAGASGSATTPSPLAGRATSEHSGPEADDLKEALRAVRGSLTRRHPFMIA